MARAKKTAEAVKTATAVTAPQDEVNRIIKKPLNNLVPDELTTLVDACETNDAGEIEIQIAFSLMNEPPEGMTQEDWDKQHPSVVTQFHRDTAAKKIKSPLLMMFLLVFHYRNLGVNQLYDIANRLADPIVSKTVEKALTAKFSDLNIEDLKPIASAPAEAQ